MTLSFSPWRFLHDEDDEDDRQEAEDWSATECPVPVAVEGDRKPAADDVAETAETEASRACSHWL